VRRDPKASVSGYFYLGQLHQAKQKPRQALEDYENFVKLAPKTDDNIARAHAAIQQLKGKR